MLPLSFKRLRSAASVASVFQPSAQKSRATYLLFLSAFASCVSMGVTTNAYAGDFSQMVFFGDSLTDSGFFKGVGQQASYTTNPDPVWAQILARDNGLTANPAYVLTPSGAQPAGGTDYAVGGARVSTQAGYTSDVVPTTTQQVDGYIAANNGKLDSRGLYSVWAGANDVFAYTEQNIGGLLNPATQAATVQTILGQVSGEAVNVVGLLSQLQHAGAGTVLVVNLPNIGNTPEAAAGGALLQQLWTGEAYTFNQVLNAGISKLGGNVVALDAYSLLDEVIANPGRYGFTNATSPACTSVTPGTTSIDSGYCTRATLVAPNANLTYVFADGVHPTGAAHAVLAQYAESVLLAPSQISMLAEVPLAGAQTLTQGIDNRYRLNAGALVPGHSEAYAMYNYSHQSLDHSDNTQGLNGNANSMTAGIDHAITQNWLIGGAASFLQNKTDFGNNTGNFKVNQAMFALYSQYRQGPWAINAIGMVGNLDYSNVTRLIQLGAYQRSETGTTGGSQGLFRVGTQYDFDLGSFTASPIANLTWQNVSVDGYDEIGNDSTSMHFDKQTLHSLVSSLGAQLTTTTQLGGYTVMPFAKLAWEHENDNSVRDVRAHVTDMGGSFGLPAYMGAENTTRFDIGANVVLGSNFTAYAAYDLQYASGNTINSFQLGLKKAF